MRNGRGMPRLALVIPVLVAAAVLGGPSPAVADDWFINGTVFNDTGSDADNCPGGNDQGCVFIQPGDVVFEDASNVTLPNSPIPTGVTGFFSFQADGFFEGADMYAQYTMPDNAAYEIIAEDDVGAGGISGNYAGCSEAGAQGSSFVCSARWGGSEAAFTPSYTFLPSPQAPVPSVGQRCSGQLGGPGASVLNCTLTGQLGPTDPSNVMLLTFANLNGNQLYVSDLANGNTCQLKTWAEQCSIKTTGYDPDQIEIGPLDPSSSAWYGVELVATAEGAVVPDYVPTWPPAGNSQTAPVPKLSALAVSPRLRPGNRAAVSYRNSRASTTAFTLARATRGKRWKAIGPRRRQSSITIPGIRRRGHCRPVTQLSQIGGRKCAWRRQLMGHLVHRDRAGRNVVHFGPRVAGRALRPGRYRLTARARARGTGLLSRAVKTRFRVRR